VERYPEFANSIYKSLSDTSKDRIKAIALLAEVRYFYY
jgi:hypothetical protein